MVVQILAEMGPSAQESVSGLVQAMKNEKLRDDAADALSRMGPRGILVLIRALRTKSPDIRASAAKALREPGSVRVRGDQSTIAKVRKALKEYEEEGQTNRLRQRTADADDLREALLRCAAGEGKMKVQASVVQAHVRRTLSDPPKEAMADYEAAANDAAGRCQTYAWLHGKYIENYHEDVSFWDRCDNKYSPSMCAEMRLWLQTHR